MKLRKMSELDIILDIEGGELKIEDKDDLQVVKDLCKKFAMSQGFYGRLLRDLQEIDTTDLPIYL